MNKQRTRQEKGITLIALIITIVVLLILAVVAIRAVQDGGIINYAKNARDDYQKAQDEEQTQLQNYLNVLNEETKTEAGKKYEAISVETNCEKYYADVDGDKNPEGIIYIDIANTKSGSWNPSEYGNFGYTIENVTTGLKEYYIIKESHTTTEFGTAPVLSLVPDSTGEERFYVMALEDETTDANTTFYWYYNALDQDTWEGKITDYETVTSTGIGAGKTNTETMIAKWNAEAYGAKNDRDMWGLVREGWYIPSQDEWSAFGSIFGVTLSNFGDLGLGTDRYWSSSLAGCAEYAWYTDMNDNGMPDGLTAEDGVRLSATF